MPSKGKQLPAIRLCCKFVKVCIYQVRYVAGLRLFFATSTYISIGRAGTYSKNIQGKMATATSSRSAEEVDATQHVTKLERHDCPLNNERVVRKLHTVHTCAFHLYHAYLTSAEPIDLTLLALRRGCPRRRWSPPPLLGQIRRAPFFEENRQMIRHSPCC